ncbi:MAG: histidinol-phosphatase [Eubacterium sp.]
MKNFHTHTFRCHHANGADRDYVEAAIEAGYDEIGFSDHIAYPFPCNYQSSFRMELNMMEDYVSSILSLKEQYRDKIKIHLGFEAEYYPELFDNLLKFIEQFDYDYLILGQHYISNEYDSSAFYSGAKTKDVDKLDRYINQVLEGLNTGKFAYLAHPDLINFIGSKRIYEQKMKEFVKELHKLDIPLECNLLGFTGKRQYPNPIFWKSVAKEGNRVIIGLDAHKPEVYKDIKSRRNLEKFLSDLGITSIENINIKE